MILFFLNITNGYCDSRNPNAWFVIYWAIMGAGLSDRHSEEMSGISNEIAQDVQTTSDRSDYVAASTAELTNNMLTLTGSFDEIVIGINILAMAVAEIEELTRLSGEIDRMSARFKLS